MRAKTLLEDAFQRLEVHICILIPSSTSVFGFLKISIIRFYNQHSTLYKYDIYIFTLGWFQKQLIWTRSMLEHYYRIDVQCTLGWFQKKSLL